MNTNNIRPSTRVGIPPRTKALRLERTMDSWLLWTSANIDFTAGTYLELFDDGAISRVTVQPDGDEERLEVKPPTKML